jgi:HEPN domain-containing protein
VKKDYLSNWLAKANNDLTVAEHELNLNKDNCVTDAVCFHCQQAIEKYLKAYLIYQKIDFGKTHNLEYLIKLCANHDKTFAALDVKNLSFYAVEIRYPDDFYIPAMKEATESFKIAQHVRDFVLGKINHK